MNIRQTLTQYLSNRAARKAGSTLARRREAKLAAKKAETTARLRMEIAGGYCARMKERMRG